MFANLKIPITSILSTPTLENLNLNEDDDDNAGLSFCWPTQTSGIFHVIPLANGSQLILTVSEPYFWQFQQGTNIVRNAHNYWPFLAPKIAMTYICRIYEHVNTDTDADIDTVYLKRLARAIDFAQKKHAYPITVIVVIRKTLLSLKGSNDFLDTFLTPFDTKIGLFEIPQSSSSSSSATRNNINYRDELKSSNNDDDDNNNNDDDEKKKSGSIDTTFWHLLYRKFRILSGPCIYMSVLEKMKKCLLTASMNCSREIRCKSFVYPQQQQQQQQNIDKINTGERDYYHVYIPFIKEERLQLDSSTNDTQCPSGGHGVVAKITPANRSMSRHPQIQNIQTNNVQKILCNIYNWTNALCQLNDSGEIDEYLRSKVLFQDFNLSMLDHVDCLKIKITNNTGNEILYATSRAIKSQIKDLAKWTLDEFFIAWPWYIYKTMCANKLSCDFYSFINTLFGSWRQTIGYQLECLDIDESTTDSDSSYSSDDDGNGGNEDYFDIDKTYGCKIPIVVPQKEENSFSTKNFLFRNRQVYYKVTTDPDLPNVYYFINLTQLARYNDIFFVYESLVYKIRFEFFKSRAYIIYQTLDSHHIDYTVLFRDSVVNQQLMEQIVARLGLDMVEPRSKQVKCYDKTSLIMFSHRPEIKQQNPNSIGGNSISQRVGQQKRAKKWPGIEAIETSDYLDIDETTDFVLNTTSQDSHTAMFNIHISSSSSSSSSDTDVVVYEIDKTLDVNAVHNKICKKQHYKSCEFLSVIVKSHYSIVVRLYSAVAENYEKEGKFFTTNCYKQPIDPTKSF